MSLRGGQGKQNMGESGGQENVSRTALPWQIAVHNEWQHFVFFQVFFLCISIPFQCHSLLLWLLRAFFVICLLMSKDLGIKLSLSVLCHCLPLLGWVKSPVTCHILLSTLRIRRLVCRTLNKQLLVLKWTGDVPTKVQQKMAGQQWAQKEKQKKPPISMKLFWCVIRWK